MDILDDQKNLAKYNKSKVIESLSGLASQIFSGWQGVSAMSIPGSYRRSQNVVFCGMGGSNLSSELTRCLFGQEMVPFILVRDYSLPRFIDRKTLVVICSYSGNTEEVLHCMSQAIKAKAKIFCLATGGDVMTAAKRFKVPFFRLPQEENPSGQPRYGVGLQLGATMALFAKLKMITCSTGATLTAITYINVFNRSVDANRPSDKNQAKKIAHKIYGRLPMLVTADFLAANGHILTNQIQESAKNLAFNHVIPELNHHLMEGLSFPEAVKAKIIFIFFNSSAYPKLIRARFLVTQKVLQKQGIEFIEYDIDGDDRLSASLEVLTFGGWLSFYLAVLNKKDPAQIPWVNFFKQELHK